MDFKLTEEEHEVEKEKANFYIQYMISHFTAPSFGKENHDHIEGRKRFLESITPKVEKKAPPDQSYEWDYDLLKKLSASQNGG